MPLTDKTTKIGPVKDNVQKSCEEVITHAEAANPGHYVTQVYGYDPSSTPEHSAGTALDLMVYSDRQLGDWIADYLWANRSRLKVRWIIWRQRIRSTSPGKGDDWRAMADRGSVTQNHFDHVHVNFWETRYVGTDTVSSPTQTQPTPDWDGISYPGRDAFNLGSNHPAVTRLGEMLVAKGFGAAYKEGPGVPMGQADVDNCAAFQRSQGWSGSDADGYPGPETWKRLSDATPPAPEPPKAEPAPAPQTPKPSEPEVQGGHGDVWMSKMHEGQNDSDSVRNLQQALRDYPGISTIPLNPHGVTGYYGSETAAMVELVYRTFDQRFPGQGWGQGDLRTPGRSLLRVLGLNVRD